MTLKCIGEKCDYYSNSNLYQETCQLVSKRVLLDRCYGLDEVVDKREEIGCKIQKLTKEYVYLSLLGELVKDNQD